MLLVHSLLGDALGVDCAAAGEEEREKIERLEGTLENANRRNAALDEELSNLKRFMASSLPGSLTPVRISRQHLRPLTAADVALLRASNSSNAPKDVCSSLDLVEHLAANASHPTRVGIELQGGYRGTSDAGAGGVRGRGWD